MNTQKQPIMSGVYFPKDIFCRGEFTGKKTGTLGFTYTPGDENTMGQLNILAMSPTLFLSTDENINIKVVAGISPSHDSLKQSFVYRDRKYWLYYFSNGSDASCIGRLIYLPSGNPDDSGEFVSLLSAKCNFYTNNHNEVGTKAFVDTYNHTKPWCRDMGQDNAARLLAVSLLGLGLAYPNSETLAGQSFERIVADIFGHDFGIATTSIVYDGISPLLNRFNEDGIYMAPPTTPSASELFIENIVATMLRRAGILAAFATGSNTTPSNGSASPRWTPMEDGLRMTDFGLWVREVFNKTAA